MRYMIKKIISIDIEELLGSLVSAIPYMYKKSFLWICGVVNLVFAWHSITFFWGDHDWGRVRDGVRFIQSGLPQARFMSGFPLLVFGGDILPLWNNIWCFVGFSLGVMALAKYWRIPMKTPYLVLFGLFIILMPYTLHLMWFVFLTNLFWVIFFAAIGLNLSSVTYKNMWVTGLMHSIVISLFIISMGMMACAISTIIIFFLGRIFIDIFEQNHSIKKLMKDYWKSALDILLSGVGYFVIFFVLKKMGYFYQNEYHSQLISPDALWNRILLILKTIIEVFYIPADYIDTPFKIILGLPLLLSVILLFFKKKQQIIKGLLILFGIGLSSQITLMIAAEPLIHLNRVDFFSLPYIYALGVVISFKQKGIVKSLTLVAVSFCIFYSALQDIRCQKVWYFAKQGEMLSYNEAVRRVKVHPDFLPHKQYDLILIGAPRPLDDAFNKYNPHYRSYFQRPAVLDWAMVSFFNFYEKDPFIKRFIRTPKLTDEIKNYFGNKREFPGPEAILIKDNTIYILFDKTKLK